MAFLCSVCKKKKDERLAYGREFNAKYGNRSCPDCGRVSQRVAELIDNHNGYKSNFIGCLECNPMLKYVDYTDRVCSDCFEEKNKMLLNQQGKQIFLRIILPSAVGGVIIGFLLG